MKLIKLSACRFTVFLLCLCLLTGMVLPVLALTRNPSTQTPSPAAESLVLSDSVVAVNSPLSGVTSTTPAQPEGAILTVYEQAAGSDPIAVKRYKPSELAALKTSGAVGYQYWKAGKEMLIAATEYVTISSLLSDAGLTFTAGDTLSAADAKNFTSSLSYEDMESNHFYITESGSIEVPAALALSWNSGSGTVEEIAATAKDTGNIRFCYGISEQQYTDQSAAGKRLVSGVTSVTVTHSAKPACTHSATEIINAKAATCTESGYTGDKVCAACGAVLEKGTEVPAICPGSVFKDMPKVGSWAHEGIDFCITANLFKGVADDRFEPDGTMTRAMLVTVLWRLSNMPASKGSNPFRDVPTKGGWYTDAVTWAAENKIVLGVSADRFEPDANVTREQIAVILCRYAEAFGKKTDKQSKLNSFPDYSSVNAWAKDAVSWAVAEKIIGGSRENGKDYLRPQDQATRAQLTTIIMRYMQNIIQ